PGVPAMPSHLHLADEAPTDERPLPPPRSSSPSHTAVVPPLSHSALRTYLAAIIAAVTVAAVTLLVLRPWARGGDPVIVPIPTTVPTAAPPPVVTERPAPAPKQIEVAPPPVVVAQAAPGPAPTLDILSRPPGARVTVDGEQLRAATP